MSVQLIGLSRRRPSALFFGRFLKSFANAKNVSVRVPQVHFAHIPRHVGWWEGDVQPGRLALPVGFIHILDPHRHPSALIRRFVAVRSERGDVRSAAASSLPSLTKKNLACAGSHRPETGWRPPVPTLLPAPLLKPREAGRDVGHIQDRGNGFCFHGEKG